MCQRISLALIVFVLLVPQLQGCVAAAAGAATGGAVVARDRRTAGTILDDQSIEIKANYAIARHKELWKKSHISILSFNNVLLLVGQTPTEEYRKEIEAAVSEIPKVRRVHNEIQVEPPVSLATRSLDSWITTQIKTKLIGSKTVSAARIKVITEDKVVYLMGLTTPEEELTATEIARAIPQVDKVVQIFEREPSQ